MPAKKKSQRTVSPRVQSNLKKIVPPAVGMRNVGAKVLRKTIPKMIKVAGQKKKMKVNNWAKATQPTLIRRRRPRFSIKKYK